jgi:hypothetical protein
MVIADLCQCLDEVGVSGAVTWPTQEIGFQQRQVELDFEAPVQKRYASTT